MSQDLISKLTPEQEILFSAQKQKWLSVISKPIEKEKVKEILAKTYRYWGKAVPKLLIVDSPKAAYQILAQKKKQKESLGLQIRELVDEQIEQRLNEQVEKQIDTHLRKQVEEQLVNSPWEQLYNQFWLPLENQLKKQFGTKKPKVSFDLHQFRYACYFDFAQKIGVNFNETDYSIYTQFFETISLYLAYENLAIIIERPIDVHWNEEGKLHAEGKPAIRFRDGFSIYAYDGTILPSKYGKLPLSQWNSKWLRGEEDSELIPPIEKWQQVCLSTESINSNKAIQAVKEIYQLMDYDEPEILFFDSPGAAFHKINSEENFLRATGKSLSSKFRKEFWDFLFSTLQNQLDSLLFKLDSEILKSLYFQQSRTIGYLLETQLYAQRMNEESPYFDDEEVDEDEDEDFDEEFSIQATNQMNAISDCTLVPQTFLSLCRIDFGISVLKCKVDTKKWKALQNLISNCGSVWLYENICLICERPNRISFDSNGCLDGVGTPAIQFPDEYSIYAFRNIWLPEKYGKIHSNQWNAEWLLEGNNAEVTQILIETIGYERINQYFRNYQFTAQDIYELLKNNLHDKVTLIHSISSSQEFARNYIDVKSLPSYEFEVITVDFKGEITTIDKKQAKIFTEDLGNNITLEMVAIPGGEFLMGTAESHGEESPQHLVKLSPFFLSKYPITQEQWRTVASLPKVKLDLNSEESRFKGNTHPVERITKEEAIEFCVRLWQFTGKLYCLPSETQWEYACRANTTTPFHFGETITTNLANYNGNYSYGNEPAGIFRKETLPVGSFPPNAFGLHDMHGNVFEWCADNWHENYHGALENGKSRIGGCDEYVPVRGGGWKSHPLLCRSANRNDEFRRCNIRYPDVGFRIAFIQ